MKAYWIKGISGPVAFCLVYLLPIPELNPEAKSVLALTSWISIWWILEFIPLAVTALLPLVAFPILGVSSGTETATFYANPIIFLFMGGFILALAIEHWDLHKRIAIHLLSKIGVDPKTIVLGVLFTSALLSMWISNTATSLMLLPIALALLAHLRLVGQNQKNHKNIEKAVLLSVAYGASIGGTATLIGTPTNLIFKSASVDLLSNDVDFLTWMMALVPVAVILLLLTWMFMSWMFSLSNTVKTDFAEYFVSEKAALGPISREEKWVALIFAIVSVAWVSRSFLLQDLIPGISDTSIAITGAMVLFVIPTKDASQPFLMTLKVAKRLPWDILLLFGGGLAIAGGFKSTGLANWIGLQMIWLQSFPDLLILLGLITMIVFLTEVTSNVATVAIMLPVVASISAKLGLDTLLMMSATTIAASFAFMLPVATPPNAVVFGSGKIEMKSMIRAGFALNIISILLLSLYAYFLFPIIF